MNPTGNCLHCGGAVYADGAKFCAGKCRSRYHASREPAGRVSSVRRLKTGVRVIVHVPDAEVSHLLRLPYLPGSDVVIVSKEE